MDFSRVGINIAVEAEAEGTFLLEKMDHIILFVKSNPICALPIIISDPKSTFDAVPLDSVANLLYIMIRYGYLF